jgi:hypothetical protein
LTSRFITDTIYGPQLPAPYSAHPTTWAICSNLPLLARRLSLGEIGRIKFLVNQKEDGRARKFNFLCGVIFCARKRTKDKERLSSVIKFGFLPARETKMFQIFTKL